MVKMKFTDNQVAFDYVIYMIAGSYFTKTKCNNSYLEKRMRIQYCEQKLNNQYRMEETCIQYVENKLLKELPNQLWENEMQVKILPQTAGGCEIQFHCPKYILKIKGKYKGNKSELTHKLWIKEKV